MEINTIENPSETKIDLNEEISFEGMKKLFEMLFKAAVNYNKDIHPNPKEYAKEGWCGYFKKIATGRYEINFKANSSFDTELEKAVKLSRIKK